MQKSELLDPVVAEATLDFRNLNKRKLLTNFPTFLLQKFEKSFLSLALRENILRVNGSDIRPWVDKTSLLRNGHGTYQSHLGDPEAKRCNCSFNGLSCKELQCFYKIDINGKGFARRMDVVWGEIAGVNGQLWLLAPILFILQRMQRVDTNIADGCDALNLGLKVGNGEDCIPRNGRWNFNKERWEVVNFSAHCDTSHLSRELINCGRNKGLASALEVNKMWAGFRLLQTGCALSSSSVDSDANQFIILYADSDAVSTEWEVESDDESEEESECGLTTLDLC
ncbi:unnamed protein product [Camellia sinensis]